MSSFEMRYKFIPDLNVILTRTKGELTIGEILDRFRVMSQDPLFDPDSHYLHDFREVEKINGSLMDHEKMAEFAVSVASSEQRNVVFLIPENSPYIQKYLEGYTLMASESNRRYWILPGSKVNEALQKIGIDELPKF